VNLPGRRSLAEIEAEMSWLNALATETAVGVPITVLAASDGLVVTVSTAAFLSRVTRAARMDQELVSNGSCP
jgi:tetrahydromethanopterin S-methyltransferase subunit D